jgi:hypothetical protein
MSQTETSLGILTLISRNAVFDNGAVVGAVVLLHYLVIPFGEIILNLV